jgi:hypothetical protein
MCWGSYRRILSADGGDQECSIMIGSSRATQRHDTKGFPAGDAIRNQSTASGLSWKIRGG